jgi:hypothetical protein
MTGLGAMMAGGNPAEGRQAGDFYATPGEVTIALCAVEIFMGTIHECASGNGAMARVLESCGYKVFGTDINPQGYGSQKDLFEIKEPIGDNIVTNPPFNLAGDMILHIHAYLKPRKLALVLKSTYWHAASRHELFTLTQPARIYPLLWRPDFLNKGAPTMDVSWVVWDRDHSGPTQYIPLPKPETRPTAKRARVAIV